jgi:hypothetical protein
MIVISRMVGGIGNQLFQYAASLAFSQSNNAKLCFDLSTFTHPAYVNEEGYLLDKIFKIDVCQPTRFEYFKTLGLAAPLLPLRYRVNYEKLCSNYFVEKTQCQVEERFFAYEGKHCYLEGFWQLEDYFKNIREMIISKLHFNYDALSHTALEMSQKLMNQNSVSIHVRRGDYIDNKVYSNLYHECNEQYFLSAMTFISERVPDVKFYVFSDDVKWAKAQSFFGKCNFIEYGSASGSWNDLFLMSCCQHNIIANSSFSWWGAWLNQNPVKIVVGPKHWFNIARLYDKSPMPKNWIKI